MELEAKMVNADVFDNDMEKVGTTVENILQEADRLTSRDRNNDYGHPLDDYETTALIWSGILRHKLKENITPEESMLCMVGVKLSRESRKHKRDNLVDGAGYFRTIEMAIDERERRETWVDKEAQQVMEKLRDNRFEEVVCPVCTTAMEHQFGKLFRCAGCCRWAEG